MKYNRNHNLLYVVGNKGKKMSILEKKYINSSKDNAVDVNATVNQT